MNVIQSLLITTNAPSVSALIRAANKVLQEARNMEIRIAALRFPDGDGPQWHKEDGQ